MDKILDEIIKDYQTFEELLKTSNEKSASQEKEIADLKSDIRKVELELAEIKKHISTVPDGKNISQDNLKLLKKISVYENALWKKGINPSKLTSGSDNC